MPISVLCAVPADNQLVRAVLGGAGYPLPGQSDWREPVTVKGITFCPVVQNEIDRAIAAGKFDCSITDVKEGYHQITEEGTWHSTMVPVLWSELGVKLCYTPACSPPTGKRRRVAKLEAAARAFLQRQRSVEVRCQLPRQSPVAGSAATRQRTQRSGWRNSRETVPFAGLGSTVVDLLNAGARHITICAVGEVKRYYLH